MEQRKEAFYSNLAKSRNKMSCCAGTVELHEDLLTSYFSWFSLCAA